MGDARESIDLAEEFCGIDVRVAKLHRYSQKLSSMLAFHIPTSGSPLKMPGFEFIGVSIPIEGLYRTEPGGLVHG